MSIRARLNRVIRILDLSRCTECGALVTAQARRDKEDAFSYLLRYATDDELDLCEQWFTTYEALRGRARQGPPPPYPGETL
jgi:hypothetical protein